MTDSTSRSPSHRATRHLCTGRKEGPQEAETGCAARVEGPVSAICLALACLRGIFGVWGYILSVGSQASGLILARAEWAGGGVGRRGLRYSVGSVKQTGRGVQVTHVGTPVQLRPLRPHVGRQNRKRCWVLGEGDPFICFRQIPARGSANYAPAESPKLSESRGK